MIDYAMFPYKTALSAANFNTEWVVKNGPITNNRVLSLLYYYYYYYYYHY